MNNAGLLSKFNLIAKENGIFCVEISQLHEGHNKEYFSNYDKWRDRFSSHKLHYQKEKGKSFLIATQIFLHKVLQVLIQLILIHKLPQHCSQFSNKRLSKAYRYRNCYFGMLNIQWKCPYHFSYKNSSNRTSGMTSAFSFHWKHPLHFFAGITSYKKLWNVHSSLKHKYTRFPKCFTCSQQAMCFRMEMKIYFWSIHDSFFVELANK